jgi:uracil-DNA glycosylase family 4
MEQAADILTKIRTIEQCVYNPYTPLMEKTKFPFYPLNSIGMPLPGPDFLKEAVALGDPDPVFDKTQFGRVLRNPGPELEKLYYRALYEPNFCIPINVKGFPTTPTLIPGHLWGGEVAGPRPAKVMVIGKWPGAEELRSNRNMIGPSGQLTVQMLEEAGVTGEEYSQWYMTNLLKHPNLDPSGNRIVANWLQNSLVLLEQELRIVRPDYILALGAEASKALIDDDFKFEASAGQVFRRRVRLNLNGWPDDFKDIKIMACIHPAFVLRQNDRVSAFRDGVKRFAQLLRGEDFTLQKEEVDHRVITNERMLKELVDEIISEETGTEQPIIAIDSEWHGDYPTESGAYLRTIQFSHKPGFAACVVLRGQGGAESFFPYIEAAVPHLKRLLVSTESRKVRIAGHHLRADLPWIAEGFDKELGYTLIRQFDGPETPELTRTEGGFDTMLAAHAVTEAPGKMGFKLEVLALGICGVRRYDLELQKWKKKYCNENNLKDEELEGYGECPNDVLHPYANWDADATRRLVEAYNKPDGLLDKDQYGNNCREPFWEAMCATPACLEMEMTGLMIDRKRGEELTEIYIAAKNDLTDELQQILSWPDFNPNSNPQCKTMLFGPTVACVRDKHTGQIRDLSKEKDKSGVARTGVTLGIKPIKTSGKPARPWEWVEKRHETHLYSPCTDKEVLGILRAKYLGKPEGPPIEKLRHIRFAGQVIKSVLRPPLSAKATKEYILDEDGEMVFEKGLLSCIMADGRIRTHIFQTLETGRFSSARPPLQNISKRRESDYKQILGPRYKYALRSMITSAPGHVLIEADYLGAELFMMAIQSGDPVMIDHCQRANLPEHHADFYDIHSNIAVKAFKLNCAPTKAGLDSIGKTNLRTAAKTIAFGIPYGRGSAAVIRAVEEEGVKLTLHEADIIRDTILTQYSRLGPYLDGAAARVHDPGWLANCFRRFRRFQKTGIADGGEMERQAKNYGIQSGVASAVNRALKYLYNRPDRINANGDYRYRIVLQIHDAVLFEVRIEDIDWVVDVVIPWAMTDMVGIHQCTYDGDIVPGGEEYHMGTDVAVMFNWGDKIPLATGTAQGIPARFCAKPKK